MTGAGERAPRAMVVNTMRKRDFLTTGAGIAAALMLAPGAALALVADEAEAHVQATVDELLALVREPGTAEEKAPRLREIVERRAALAQMARFSAGIEWRSMTEDQRARYSDAFAGYFARIYARRFETYGEPTVTIDGTVDAGSKGILVKSRFLRTDGPPVFFEWLVTDRTGTILIADIVIEGVSTVVTQRNEITALISASADIDAFIDKLNTI